MPTFAFGCKLFSALHLKSKKKKKNIQKYLSCTVPCTCGNPTLTVLQIVFHGGEQYLTNDRNLAIARINRMG